MNSVTPLRQLFAYPFRIFFLSLAIWAVLIVPLWLLLLLTPLQLPLALPMVWWHQYEMLFGLLSAAIAGFLLTAVCAWTGTAPTRGGLLLALWLLWLAGRLSMMFGEALPLYLVHTVNLLFLPAVIVDVGRRILRGRQWRQLPVLLVLALLWWSQWQFSLAPQADYGGAALLMAVALMLIIGGRITPVFSANWLRLRGESEVVRVWPALDHVTVAMAIALLPLYLWAPPSWLGLGATLTAVLALVRLWAWRGWYTRAEPLLWVLHLSLLWIPVALLLLAGSTLGWWPATVWLHAAGIGAMGGLILGVIARVSLGHTGRPLSAPRGMGWAFAALSIAALLRVLAALDIAPFLLAVLLSGALWTLAYAAFLWHYTSVLCSPRVDGKAG